MSCVAIKGVTYAYILSQEEYVGHWFESGLGIFVELFADKQQHFCIIVLSSWAIGI